MITYSPAPGSLSPSGDGLFQAKSFRGGLEDRNEDAPTVARITGELSNPTGRDAQADG